jgi:hypothetical protein
VPFDAAMPKIRVLHVNKASADSVVDKVIIGDVLDDVLHRPYDNRLSKSVHKKVSFNRAGNGTIHAIITNESISLSNANLGEKNKPIHSTSYDIRTRKRLAGDILEGNQTLTEMEDFHKIVAQVRFINGDYEGYNADELKALGKWLQGLEKPQELQHFFETTILKSKPRQLAAFRQSPLHKAFQDAIRVS